MRVISGVVVQTFDLSPWEIKIGRSIQGLPGQPALYMVSCLIMTHNTKMKSEFTSRELLLLVSQTHLMNIPGGNPVHGSHHTDNGLGISVSC